MNRFSEQRARLGAFVGSGVNYVAAKTALTRSQWLMLMTFAVGAVVVGFVSTRWSKPQSFIDNPIAAKQTSGSETSKYAPPSTVPQVSEIASTRGSPGASTSPAAPTPVAVPPSALKSDAKGPIEAKTVAGIEPATRSLLEGLARDIAKINQKIDDLAGKQRQTASRLALLIADGKQSRTRPADDADRPESSNRKSVASAAPKAVPMPAARELTVRPTRKPQRPTEVERRHRASVEATMIERRVRVAERNRRVRRRIASRSSFGRPL